MAKQPSPLKQINISDELSENPFVDWLSANKGSILVGLAVVLTLLLFASRFISSRNLNAEADFLQSQVLLTEFQNRGAEMTESDSLPRLEDILSRHPDLHAKYDGLIAQELIIDREPAKARPFAEQSFQRTSQDGIDAYQDFAKTSLLVSEERYDQALIDTQQLKARMDQDTTHNFGNILYMANLVRLAVLYQATNKPAEEIAAWKAVEDYLKNNGDFALFGEGQFTLNDYIKERTKVLQ